MYNWIILLNIQNTKLWINYSPIQSKQLKKNQPFNQSFKRLFIKYPLLSGVTLRYPVVIAMYQSNQIKAT